MSIDILSAIIGAIAGALIGWFVSWRIIKSSEYYKACAMFRVAFVDTIHKLDVLKNNDPLNFKTIQIIKDGFIDQEKAILLFEPYISKRQRNKLKKAYQEYKAPHSKNRNVRSLAIYSGHTEFGYTHEEARQLALDNIEKIISFAKFKRFWFEDIFHKTT